MILLLFYCQTEKQTVFSQSINYLCGYIIVFTAVVLNLFAEGGQIQVYDFARRSH